MQGRYIPAIIMLLAGLVSSIICLIKKVAIIRSLITILVVLIIFLILGLIARKIIILTLNEKAKDTAEAEDLGENTNENAEQEHDT